MTFSEARESGWKIARRDAKHVYATHVGRERKSWRAATAELPYPAPRPELKLHDKESGSHQVIDMAKRIVRTSRVRPVSASAEQMNGGDGLWHKKANIKFLNTGCTLLNLTVSADPAGGWPFGRIVNIIGDKSTGKTLLAEEAMANCLRQYPLGKIHYRESEAAWDADYAEALGLDTDRIDFGPDGKESIWSTIEDVFEDLDKCLTAIEDEVKAFATDLRKKNRKIKLADALTAGQKAIVPSLYIIDSLDALTSDSEIARDIREGAYNLGKQKLVNELFRKYRKRLREAQMCLIIISQTRQKIGPMIRGVSYRRVCEDPLNFFSSVVIYLSELGKLKKKIKSGDKELWRTTGIIVKVRCDKNKIASPHGECTFTIRFRYGIDDELSSLDYLKDVDRLDAAGYEQKPSDLDAVDSGKLRSVVTSVWRDLDERITPVKGKYVE
jgi:recombination protein RecA